MTAVTLKSTIEVEYKDSMGDDRRIVEAMLVSTQGLSAEDAAEGPLRGRIGHIMRNRHGSPFECSALTLRVHCPMVVIWEWVRHRAGWSYNVESGRYKQLEPVFYLPPPERPMFKAAGFKSSDPEFRPPTPEEYAVITARLLRHARASYASYEEALAFGEDNSQARYYLGPNVFFSMYATCNVRSLMHLVELRTIEPEAARPSKPVWEFDNVARQLEGIFAARWPLTHELWNKHRRQAP